MYKSGQTSWTIRESDDQRGGLSAAFSPQTAQEILDNFLMWVHVIMEQGVTGDLDTLTYNRGSTGQNYARWDSIIILMRRDLIKKGVFKE